MKKIISTLGTEILFNLSSSRKLTISPTEPIEVTDEEFKILDSRLGGQIKTVDGVFKSEIKEIIKEKKNAAKVAKNDEVISEEKVSEEKTEEKI